MRRKPGALLPLEVSLLDAGVDLRKRGTAEFHGYLVAHEMRERADARRLTAHGTLYRALERMETAGLLASRWEDPLLAADEGRPRRRLYRITAAGERALARARNGHEAEAPPRRERGLAPS